MSDASVDSPDEVVDDTLGLADHPLTRMELEREAEYLSTAGYKLKF